MLKLFSSMLCTYETHSFSLGNLIRIRVTNVERTRLGLEWPLTWYVALYSW